VSRTVSTRRDSGGVPGIDPPRSFELDSPIFSRRPAKEVSHLDEHSHPVGRRRQRDTIHLLNRRYHEQWERAERLERELALARRAWIGPLHAWLRRLKQWLCPVRYAGLPGSKPGELACVSCVRIGEAEETPRGRVSIIIPFKDQVDLLRGCLLSLRKTDYRDREIILVNNGSCEPRTLRCLERLRGRQRVHVVDSPEPFNFSRLCNQGAQAATGEYLLFLNNDTEVLAPDWLGRLLRLACRPEVGIVGATLLYPDGTIQHAGLFPRGKGTWIHGYRGRRPDDAGDQNELGHCRTVPAVTGACLLLRRDLFETLGGFDERLPLTYNDVDLCCRVRARNKLVVVSPHARLLHFEGLSRGFSSDTPGAGHLAALDGN
jgi:GT2 family glycosyltransferase